ncbi:MAG: SDR family oxidoreductase [Pirellulales bacterium]
MKKTRLIIGCGYLGLRVAQTWISAGDQVFALTRSKENGAKFQELGITPVIADVTNPQTLTDLPSCDTVLFAVGFDRKSDHSIEAVYVQGLQNVINYLEVPPQQFIYISSTGVYGDAGGAVVNEHTMCEPRRPGGKACLTAERFLLSHPQFQQSAIILRLAGIYGPGRIPRSRDLQNQVPIPTLGDGALNLIHVDDANEAVQLVTDAPVQSHIYNVSDGNSVSRREYYQHLAQLLNAPDPVFKEPEPDSPAAFRAQSDRQIDNGCFVSDYTFKPRYPSYREGLAAIVAEEAEKAATK